MAIDIHRRGDVYNVFWIAWPQALGFLVITIQNMTDMFWIGQLGTSPVAAVSLCGNVLTVLFGLSGFLHVGTVALISRALGAGEEFHASRTMFHSFLLGVASGVLLLILGWVFAPWIMGFFQVEGEVARLGILFFRIMSVFMMIFMLIVPPMAAYASAGDTFTPLVLNSIGMICNVILDPIFIFSPGQAVEIGGWVIHPGVFGWGLWGAGFASVVSIALIFGLYVFSIPLGRFPIRFAHIKKVTIDLYEFWWIIKIGAPFAIAHMSRPLSTVILLRIISGFGVSAVAGFGIAMRWYHVNWILVGGMGAATSVLVGQYLGAASPDSASRVSRRLITAGFVIQILGTALYFYYAPFLIAVIDPNPETVKAGSDFMRWVVLGFLISTPGGLAAAAMNGAGDTMPGMIAGVVSNWLVKLPLAWALAHLPHLGLYGVWLAMFISLFVEGLICLVWYRRGKWEQKVLYKYKSETSRFVRDNKP